MSPRQYRFICFDERLAPPKTISDLARRWHDLVGINAGRIADGEVSIEAVGWEMFRLMLDLASGRKKTLAKHWKLHNALVL